MRTALPLGDATIRTVATVLIAALLPLDSVPRAQGPAGDAAWQPLFDGKTLTNWESTKFGGEGRVTVENGQIVLPIGGGDLTGITWTGPALPVTNYELSVQAMRVDGSDFFAGITFPVGDSFCSLILGGWGGTVVGLSSINGMDASENDTSQSIAFERGRWYDVRIRVTPEKIESWLDGKQIIDQEIRGRKIQTRIEVEPSQPLGIAAWRTRSAVREIRLRKLPEPPAPTPRMSASVEELLWWLPPNTETIQVTQTPHKPAHGPLFDGMEFVRGEIGVGDVSYAATLAQHLRTARIKATVDGARRFRPPSGLGSTLYEGALIILFERPIAARSELIAALSKSAVSVQDIQGVPTIEYRDMLENDIWTSLIASPRPDVLLIACDRSYLEELLRRRNTRTGSRALPGDLPEWRWVDTSAPFWAVRHFRRDATAGDPTSPFARDRAGGGFDPQAIGVTTHATPDGDTIVAHYVSAAKDPEQIARRMWHHPGDGVTPVFRRVDDRVVEARFNARDEEHLAAFLFYLFASLGHATYV